MNDFLYSVGSLISILVLIFFGGFAWQYARNLAENRTRKVCDVCFRDIKLWNEAFKRSKEEQEKKSA